MTYIRLGETTNDEHYRKIPLPTMIPFDFIGKTSLNDSYRIAHFSHFRLTRPLSLELSVGFVMGFPRCFIF